MNYKISEASIYYTKWHSTRSMPHQICEIRISGKLKYHNKERFRVARQYSETLQSVKIIDLVNFNYNSKHCSPLTLLVLGIRQSAPTAAGK